MKAHGIAFLKQMGLALLVVAVPGIPLLALYGDRDLVWGASIGCAICTVNALAGCFSAIWSFDKPQAVFLKAVLGGMAVRILAIGLIFFILVKFTGINVVGLTLSLFGFYVLFQVLEVRFLVKHLSDRQAMREGS